MKVFNEWLPDLQTAPADPKNVRPEGIYVDAPPFPPRDEWHVQRLSEQDYWLFANAYSLTAHIGTEGVLLIDAPPAAVLGGLNDVLKTLTSAPVTAVVYSHNHVDHIGGSPLLAGESASRGEELRIIGTDRCAAEIRRYRNSAPAPTDVVTGVEGSFAFEGQTFRMITPVEVAHSGADSLVITPGGVSHAIDFVHAGTLPHTRVSGVRDLTAYIRFLRIWAGDTSWSAANFGHASLGYRSDVLRTLEYFSDLYDAWYELIADTWTLDRLTVNVPQDTSVALRQFFDESAAAIATAVAPKWGHVPHFECCRDHAEAVCWDIFLNYDWVSRPEDRPSFAPLKSATDPTL